MAHIDLVALQQRLAQQPHLAHHVGAESYPSRRFGCGGTLRANAQIDELNAELVVARAEAARALPRNKRGPIG